MTNDAAFWNKLAERYAKQPLSNPDAFEQKIAITRSLMSPGCALLEVGCGTGSLALRLASAAGRIHGLDVSSEMIGIAQSKATAAGVSNVTFQTGPFDEGFHAIGPASVDGVCAYSILHLLPDRTAALARIHDLIKPGGFFVSSTVCLGDSWVPYRPVIALARLLGKAPWVAIITRQALLDELVAAGFEQVEARDVGGTKSVAFIVARKPG
mgnify:FL=1